jgi:hypothetical protein
VADLKGKRIPFGFKGSPLFHHLITAGMANGGISWDDVKKVPTVGLRQSWNIFKQGKIDMAWFGVGSGITREMQASISGGIRYLSFDDTLGPKRMEKVLPQGFYGGKDARKYEYATVKAPSPLPGIKSTVKVFGFDYLLWTGKGVSEEIVYQVTKAMFEHEKEIKSTSAVWRSHKSTRMGKNHGPTYRYHPGAIRLYKEKGVWKR